MADLDFASITLAGLAERTSDPDDIPGAGGVCGLVIQLSASLVAGTARASSKAWPRAGGLPPRPRPWPW
ncbi:MAG: hypothetical protein FJW90_08240 [Actinobacteria bacterium]|nr:hypothetical protein [Actinomycetota bacterium]